jgi:hypothetical protein
LPPEKIRVRWRRRRAENGGVGSQPRGPEVEAAAHVAWIRTIGDYGRRETNELQVARYG